MARTKSLWGLSECNAKDENQNDPTLGKFLYFLFLIFLDQERNQNEFIWSGGRKGAFPPRNKLLNRTLPVQFRFF